jgi:hypothetical protein
LQRYIEDVLDTSSVPVGLGIFCSVAPQNHQVLFGGWSGILREIDMDIILKFFLRRKFATILNYFDK